ncbi:hypothetical protein K4A83_13145 [Spirulina subsalsa FACHB-351]|uniref:Uncharacterized protein n=1 Tax=Spirulina subsalsa FACHB-351 TaxID=234711 RepID=A0ABT3L6S6_9CYAN|nr:hypothetical protein [Spirulina subsalsa]MCW6037208.1 hypothetical protein [Spirulina subsalsa FACHB-351]
MYSCPCCGTQLLRFASKNRVYWFCRSCYQEMPIIEVHPLVHYPSGKVGYLNLSSPPLKASGTPLDFNPDLKAS